MPNPLSQDFIRNAFDEALNCPSIKNRFYCDEDNKLTIEEYISSHIIPILIERPEHREPVYYDYDYDNALKDIKEKIKSTCSLKTIVGSMKKSKNVPKKKLISLATKYNISSSGSRKKIATRLCDLRQQVLTKKERILIAPYVSNNKNKKIMMKKLSKKKKQTKRAKRTNKKY